MQEQFPEHFARALSWTNVKRVAATAATDVQGLVEPIGGLFHLHANAPTDMLWLLGMSVLCVPLMSMLPGNSPVLGFLMGMFRASVCTSVVSMLPGNSLVLGFL
jgi:hypothetical protein